MLFGFQYGFLIDPGLHDVRARVVSSGDPTEPRERKHTTGHERLQVPDPARSERLWRGTFPTNSGPIQTIEIQAASNHQGLTQISSASN